MKTQCEARRHSDQMICEWCGLVWDVDDDDPPTCPKEHPREACLTKLNEVIKKHE